MGPSPQIPGDLIAVVPARDTPADTGTGVAGVTRAPSSAMSVRLMLGWSLVVLRPTRWQAAVVWSLSGNAVLGSGGHRLVRGLFRIACRAASTAWARDREPSAYDVPGYPRAGPDCGIALWLRGRPACNAWLIKVLDCGRRRMAEAWLWMSRTR